MIQLRSGVRSHARAIIQNAVRFDDADMGAGADDQRRAGKDGLRFIAAHQRDQFKRSRRLGADDRGQEGLPGGSQAVRPHDHDGGEDGRHGVGGEHGGPRRADDAMRVPGTERQDHVQEGLPREQAYQLAVGTFEGAAALAASATEPPEVLRERVTSKGGTTHAAISAMEASGVKPAFIAAMQAARQRANELGDAFGAA